MKRKLILTAALLCVTLCVPLSVFSQNRDFEMNGTVLVKYNGSARQVTIPSGVTSIAESAFYLNFGITSITIPSSVTSIDEKAFVSCVSLANITVDNQNSAYSSVDGILFNKNRTVIVQYPMAKQGTSYTIPSSVTSIGVGAFATRNLTSITIPSSVTSIGEQAFSSGSLTSITVDNQNSAYSSVDGILFNKNRTVIVKYPASKQGTSYTIPSSVTSIWTSAFSSCKNLTSITIPSSVTSIGYSAFHSCEKLTSITIPSSVTSIGNDAFVFCSSLTSITIPSSVTSIGNNAFSMCNNLTSVTISRRTTIGRNAFPDTARITYSD